MKDTFEAVSEILDRYEQLFKYAHESKDMNLYHTINTRLMDKIKKFVYEELKDYIVSKNAKSNIFSFSTLENSKVLEMISTQGLYKPPDTILYSEGILDDLLGWGNKTEHILLNFVSSISETVPSYETLEKSVFINSRNGQRFECLANVRKYGENVSFRITPKFSQKNISLKRYMKLRYSPFSNTVYIKIKPVFAGYVNKEYLTKIVQQLIQTIPVMFNVVVDFRHIDLNHTLVYDLINTLVTLYKTHIRTLVLIIPQDLYPPFYIRDIGKDINTYITHNIPCAINYLPLPEHKNINTYSIFDKK